MNDLDEEMKKTFYYKLQTVLNKRKSKNFTLIMGDLIPKVGLENHGYVEVMGIHRLREMNESGFIFVNICANNDLAIGGTRFPHKGIHKTTWCWPV